EAAVVGKNDPITGQAIFAYVILRTGFDASEQLAEELRGHVAKVIGPIAKPKFLFFTPDLPKTRSGKIMRRLLRDIAEERALGDTTTLADPNVVETIRSESWKAEDCRVPFDFLKRKKTEGTGAAKPAGATKTGSGRGIPFDGLTEEWRIVGNMEIPGRLSDSLKQRQAVTISDVQWAPVDGSEPLAPAPGLKAGDPYALIIVA